ncbi:hypothetical protein [Niabella beijingensis]|uniref:hypothetical protein n=1 Tax=Niabella beijingensis TaxID=2872700 RepID=UPI001CBF7601|nr:hypothetical protein [Niabella beijingensis]MBZ4189394.1 hypothetical protein [Niabella beijingensis]
MQYRLLLFGVLFFAKASSGQVRTIEAEPKIKTLYPEATFDSAMALSMLAKGTASIKGQVSIKPRNQFGGKAPLAKSYLGSNMVVSLFPVTPYLEKWYQYRQQREGKTIIIAMSPLAYQSRIDTKTDDKGYFKFTELKPGKYFLQTYFDVDYTADGGYSVSRNQFYTKEVHYTERIEKFVEIRNGEDPVNVKLNDGKKIYDNSYRRRTFSD